MVCLCKIFEQVDAKLLADACVHFAKALDIAMVRTRECALAQQQEYTRHSQVKGMMGAPRPQDFDLRRALCVDKTRACDARAAAASPPPAARSSSEQDGGVDEM